MIQSLSVLNHKSERILIPMKKLILGLLFVAACYGQPYTIAPDIEQQFFDNNGQPLAGGFIYVCAALSACPGTPLASYIDSTGSVQNQNPVQLDSSGRANIWLNSTLFYKFVIQNSALVTIKTIDNVSSSTPGGGTGGSNYWTLSGTTITNNNASSLGPVAVGGNFSSAGSGTFAHGIVLQDTQSPPNTATITAPNCVGTLMGGGICAGVSATWRWPSLDAAGCLTSDGVGNLSFVTCSGGGGGGGAVGPTGSLQLSGVSGAFAFNSNLSFASSTQTLVINSAATSDPGIIVTTGGVQSDFGFNAVNNASSMTLLPFNVIQSQTGGMEALSFTAANYVQVGHSNSTPTVTLNDTFHAGALHYVDGTGLQVYDGSGWSTLATGGATPPGGATCQIQFNSSGFAGSANLTWNCAADPLTNLLVTRQPSLGMAGLDVIGGYVQSDYGLLVPASGVTASYQNINVPTGGVYAKSVFAVNYTQVGAFTGNPPPLTAGQTGFAAGALYCNTATNPCVMTYNSATTGSPVWATLGSGGGGGGGPCGAIFSIQYNNSGSCGGSANFTYASGQVTLAGTGGSFVAQGTSNGFNASTCTNFDCIQAKMGGLAALGATIGGANIARPVTISLIGTSGSGASQRAAIGWDTAGGGTPLWQAVSDTTAAGDNNWGLFTAGAGTYAITGNYATGNIGIRTNALTGAGQALNVAGTSGVAGINLTGGFVQADGGFSVNVATNFDSINTPGGIHVDVTGIGTGNNAFTTNSIKVIDYSGNVFANNLTVTGTCTGCSSGSAASFTATNIGAADTFLNSNGNFTVDGNGNVTAHGVINSTDALSVTVNTAANSIQTVGGFNADSTGGFTPVLSVRGFVIIDGSANANFGGTLAVTGITTLSSVLDANAGIISGAGIQGTGYNVTGGFIGVTCSGTPTSSFTSKNGIVTHC